MENSLKSLKKGAHFELRLIYNLEAGKLLKSQGETKITSDPQDEKQSIKQSVVLSKYIYVPHTIEKQNIKNFDQLVY